jgi:fibronectin-binding autotransporter adhesin
MRGSQGSIHAKKAAWVGAILVAASATVAHAQYYWDPLLKDGINSGASLNTGTWNTTLGNWWNGASNDVAWNNGVANFAGTAGAGSGATSTSSTVTIGANVTATSVAFATGGTNTNGNGNSGYTLVFSGTNTLSTNAISVGSGFYDTIGTNGSTTGGLNFGSTGLTVSGGGELILAQKLASTSTGPINVTGGSTLTFGNRNLTTGSITPQFTNTNAITLNNSMLQFATSATLTSNTPSIGSLMIVGNSTVQTWRTSAQASTSVTLSGFSGVTMAANSQLTIQASGNVNDPTGGAYWSFGSGTASSLILQGAATLQVLDQINTGTNGQTYAGTAASGNVSVEDARFGQVHDDNSPITFLGSGSASSLGGYIELQGYTSDGTDGSGTWTVGNASGTQGAVADVFGPTAAITTGNITVNPFSQLEFDPSGYGGSNIPGPSGGFGAAGQTITINGAGNYVTTASTGFAAGTGTTGALYFTNVTAGSVDFLQSNVVLGSNSTITVAVGNYGEIDGSLTGNYVLTKGGGGTLIVNGTGNSWGGTTITNGTIWVGDPNGSYFNSNASLGTGPVTLASDSTASSPTLVFYTASQTIGSLAASFGSTSAATNSIQLGAGSTSTALTIVQTTNTTFGIGTAINQFSTITGNGNVTLAASSTGTLNFTYSNSYNGNTAIHGGTLLANNTTGSATGSGTVTVDGGTLGGAGFVTGAVTLSGTGAIAPGSAAHVIGTLNLTGGLTLNGGSLNFDLDAPSDSDQIALGGSNFAIGSGAGGITLNLNNLGGMSAGGTYPLVTYSGSGPAVGSVNSYFNVVGPSGETYSLAIATTGGGHALDLRVTPPPGITWAVGNGNWDTTSPNWTTGTGTTNYTQGAFVTFNDTNTGGSTINVNIPSEVDPGSIVFSNNTKNYVVGGAGPIGGNVSMTITGTGSVTLTSANTFTGLVSVSGGGTLVIGADTDLGNSSNPVYLANGSTLQVTSSYSTARTLNLNGSGGTLDLPNGDALTLSGAVGGSGGLTKTDAGTLILSGGTSNDTYLGPTMISAGLLQIAASGSVPQTSDVTVAGGATFDLQTFTDYVASISGGGNITLGTGALLNIVGTTSTAFSGNITGSGGSVNKTGGSTLILSGANTFNNLTLSAGTIEGGQGQLGSGTITISGASTVLQFTSAYTSTQILSSGTGGGILNLNGNNVSLATLAGTGVPTITGGATLTLTGKTGTNTGGISVGSVSSGGDTLVINAVDGNGVSGLGTGTVSVYSGDTFDMQNIKLGYTTAGAAGTGIGGLDLYDGSTWLVTGNSAYTGGAISIDTNASVTINVPGSSDKLLDGTAIRTLATSTSNNITVEGNGLVQIGSGAVTATNTFNGNWNVNLGSSGILLFSVPAGGLGEVLNAPGYGVNPAAGATSPIYLNSGTIAFGSDAPNPAAGTIISANSFRSPLTFSDGTAIASSGYEYAATTTTSTGAIFDSTPVTANIAGDITLNGTDTVLTYDPILGTAGGSRSLNFTTNGTSVSGNFFWNGATLVVNSGGTTGGAVNFLRTSGSIYGAGGASLQITSGATVNVGGAVDPFFDGSNGVAVSVSGKFKILPTQSVRVIVGALNINSGGLVDINSELIDEYSGSDPYASLLSSVVAGYNHGAWNGTTGIISSSAAASTHGVNSLAIVDNPAGALSLDGTNISTPSVLFKYTYVGDANLDGVVNAADLTALNAGAAGHLTGWQNGDFNYDGVINADDYALFQLGAALQGSPITLSAPEPGVMGMVAVAMMGVMGRRRSRS